MRVGTCKRRRSGRSGANACSAAFLRHSRPVSWRKQSKVWRIASRWGVGLAPNALSDLPWSTMSVPSNSHSISLIQSYFPRMASGLLPPNAPDQGRLEVHSRPSPASGWLGVLFPAITKACIFPDASLNPVRVLPMAVRGVAWGSPRHHESSIPQPRGH